MAIKREKENKFAQAVAALDEQETAEQEKSGKVMKALSGGQQTKTVVDKNGRSRTVRVTEKLCRSIFRRVFMCSLMRLRRRMANLTTPPLWS